jgi:hypothetical protein
MHSSTAFHVQMLESTEIVYMQQTSSIVIILEREIIQQLKLLYNSREDPQTEKLADAYHLIL